MWSGWSGGAGLAQWWERSPSTNVSQVPGPGVICGLSLLVLYSAPRGFSPPGYPVFPSPQKPTFDLIWFVWFLHLIWFIWFTVSPIRVLQRLETYIKLKLLLFGTSVEEAVKRFLFLIGQHSKFILQTTNITYYFLFSHHFSKSTSREITRNEQAEMSAYKLRYYMVNLSDN